MMTRTLMIAATVLSHVAAATASARAGETCMADWSVAASVVRKEGLTTVEQLLKLAHKSGAGDIVRTTLCEDGGTYVYRLVVKDRNGQLKTLTVDARKPFAR
ncbi:MAG: hypothetical protein ABL908_14865 [Hyphomicrobium sp.]